MKKLMIKFRENWAESETLYIITLSIILGITLFKMIESIITKNMIYLIFGIISFILGLSVLIWRVVKFKKEYKKAVDMAEEIIKQQEIIESLTEKQEINSNDFVEKLKQNE